MNEIIMELAPIVLVAINALVFVFWASRSRVQTKNMFVDLMGLHEKVEDLEYNMDVVRFDNMTKKEKVAEVMSALQTGDYEVNSQGEIVYLEQTFVIDEDKGTITHVS